MIQPANLRILDDKNDIIVNKGMMDGVKKNEESNEDEAQKHN